MNQFWCLRAPSTDTRRESKMMERMDSCFHRNDRIKRIDWRLVSEIWRLGFSLVPLGYLAFLFESFDLFLQPFLLIWFGIQA